MVVIIMSPLPFLFNGCDAVKVLRYFVHVV